MQQYGVEHIFRGHTHFVIRTTWNGAEISEAGSTSMMSPDPNPVTMMPNLEPVGYDMVLVDDKVTPKYNALGDPCLPGIEGDFDKDCHVNMVDLAMLALNWLTTHGDAEWNPDFDISSPDDGIIDMLDIEAFADNWLADNWLTYCCRRLKAHWKLDETAGSVASDSTGDYDGTLHSNPLWRSTGGQIDGALELDGTDDYVSAPFVLNPADGEFSVFAWIKGAAPGQVVISQTGDPVGANWLSTVSSDGRLMTELMGSGRGSSALMSETVITDSNWHHIGFTWDGSYRTLYVDGADVAKDVKPQSWLKGATGELYFGAEKTLEAAGSLSGLIDDIRIYSKALSAEDIQ